MSQIIQQNQHVRCVFKNGSMIEGIVKEWKNDQAILFSLTDGSTIVICDPKADLMFVKIMPEKLLTNNQPLPPQNYQNEVQDKLQEILTTNDPQINKLKISQLKQLVVEQDKAILTQKKKEHFSAGNTNVSKYTNPFIGK